MAQNAHNSIAQRDLLGAVKAGVAQALPRDNMADAVKTVAAVVLAVLSICAIGAAHFTPMARRRNAVITAIFRRNGALSQRGKRRDGSCWLKELPLGRPRRTCPQSSRGYSGSTSRGWGHSGARLYTWDTLPGSFHQRSLSSRAGHSVSRSSRGHR